MSFSTFAPGVSIRERVAAGSLTAADPLEQMAEADRADWALLRLVLCAAMATFVLALAGSLQI